MYAYFQKVKMKNKFKLYYNSGLIQFSISPFYSHVLVVEKKKDNILPELQGAIYFTKLDLQEGYHLVCIHPPDNLQNRFLHS